MHLKVGGLCYMATEKLRDMELSRSHCPRGGLAGLTPPLSSPKPTLFLLKLDASQMFLFCPYVRAISMSLVPKRDGNRKPWPTNENRRGYKVPEDWGSRPGRVPQWDFQASIFSRVKAHQPPTHCLATAQSHCEGQRRDRVRESTCALQRLHKWKGHERYSVKWVESIPTLYRFLVLQLTSALPTTHSSIMKISTKF